MKSLDQSPKKSEQTPIVIASGRVRRVDLILPVVVNRIPQWLETVLTPYKERFAHEWCPDFWAALYRLSFFEWRDRWGSVEGQEWFVSEPIVSEDEERILVHLAKQLKIDFAMSLADHRYLLAARGTWSRR